MIYKKGQVSLRRTKFYASKDGSCILMCFDRLKMNLKLEMNFLANLEQIGFILSHKFE